MLRISEAKMKEVINIANGERMGFIYDFELDLEKGEIVSLIIADDLKPLSLFSKPSEIIINWQDIVKIGQDTILVDYKG
ncbi:MAG: YlmC/YmxH family sporulation protein [Tissierellia bacterium]|nr:YlmC/YmxH family sporulation protein [Tissierellia bacterium]